MLRRLCILVLGVAAFWLLAGYPACRLSGDGTHFVYSGVAVGLCLVPTALTLAWGRWALRQPPQQQLVMVMGGTGVRLAVVLIAAFAFSSQPYFQRQSFWAWLVAAYVFSLGLEMVLLLAGRPSEASVSPTGGMPAPPGSP